MKKLSRIFLIGSVLTAMLLSACGAAAVDSAGANKGNASLVEFTGIIDAINGDQWTVNGQVITVDPAVVKDGPFLVGDKVKVEADVQADGSVVITRVETPSAPVAGSTDVPIVPSSTVDPLSTPQASSTPDPAATGIVFDDSGNEAFGSVDGFDGTTIVIGGQSFTVANGAEIKDTIAAGDFVKVEFILNSDGTLSIREMQLWDPAAVGSGNSGGSDDGPNHDLNDDHGDDDDDQNDDHGNDGPDHDQNDDQDDDAHDDDSGNNSGSGG